MEDLRWPTDNAWDVPVLDLELQADPPVAPIECWGRVARTTRMTGTLHFYTADYRFAALWKKPEALLRTGASCAVEPNFSSYAQTPRAVVLHRVFQRRWLARFWQSRGVRILVDLNVAAEHRDLALLGVPQGWRAYATRGHQDHLDELVQEFEMACNRAGSRSVTFLVYGGSSGVVRDFARGHGWTWCPEQADVAHGRLQGGLEAAGGG